MLVERSDEVHLAANGQEVLDHPMLEHVDAILMDIQMPLMDGLTATQKLRERGFKKPVLACTGLMDSSIEARTLAAGCSHFISKPLDINQIRPLLRTLNLPEA